ncbi:hypothetical protein AD998_11150 [bacterium 336/3]|nr:hypothetical protein AD998_11150 [bacterium 336/3]
MAIEKKEYSNGEITVVWQPKMCIHSAVCFRGLKSVFDPNKRPWVNIEGANTEQIVAQIEKCPSKALSYYHNNAQNDSTQTKKEETTMQNEDKNLKIEILPNGPILVQGNFTLKHGEEEKENAKSTTYLCRCGASKKKPYCDGSHKNINFEG